MTAYQFIRGLAWLPSNDDGDLATNSDIRRWFDRRSVIINGTKPAWRDEVEYPITELIFFPKGKRRTTVLSDALPEVVIDDGQVLLVTARI